MDLWGEEAFQDTLFGNVLQISSKRLPGIECHSDAESSTTKTYHYVLDDQLLLLVHTTAAITLRLHALCVCSLLSQLLLRLELFA